MISYGQNSEDVLLNRLFPADHKGFYIDVGASHPTVGSVTAHFYARGWRGINVEPSCSYSQVLDARPRDTNLQLALSNHSGMATFHEFPEAAGLSTFTPELADFAVTRFGFKCVRRAVAVSTLAEICREHVRQPIDFLSVDVEGHERAVLEGADWKQFRPRAVVVEATRPHTTETTHAEWEGLLLAADYVFAFFDGLNRFYVRAEDRDLALKLAVPANVFDNFVTYSEQCSLDRLHALTYRLDTTEKLGRVPLAVARRLNDIETQVRRLPAAIRRLLGGA